MHHHVCHHVLVVVVEMENDVCQRQIVLRFALDLCGWLDVRMRCSRGGWVSSSLRSASGGWRDGSSAGRSCCCAAVEWLDHAPKLLDH